MERHKVTMGSTFHLVANITIFEGPCYYLQADAVAYAFIDLRSLRGLQPKQAQSGSLIPPAAGQVFPKPVETFLRSKPGNGIQNLFPYSYGPVMAVNFARTCDACLVPDLCVKALLGWVSYNSHVAIWESS